MNVFTFLRLHYNLKTVITIFLFLEISFGCSAMNERVGVEEEYFEVSEDSVVIDLFIYKKGDEYIINDTIDLNCKTLYLPQNISMVVKKGLFKNGRIVGNNTSLKYNKVVFDHVHIGGTWRVPHIKSTMFANLSYNNALKDVIALSNSSINNVIDIERDDYYVSVTRPSDVCLSVYSNTEIRLDGNVFLLPNGYSMYNIIRTAGDNIVIKGKGSIIGDRQKHLSNDGEWGMGISLYGGNNIKIIGISIKDCWGDCIYVYNNADCIEISGCLLEHSRRQGISVISCKNIKINNCKILCIQGTKPEYAIDIEPNENDTIVNVFINNVYINNCHGGIASSGRAKNAFVNSIKIKQCTIENCLYCPIRIVESESTLICNNRIYSFDSKNSIECFDVDNVNINSCSIDKNNNLYDLFQDNKSISVLNAKKKRIKKIK